MKLIRRFRFWLRARENQADLAEEMELHCEMLGDARSMGNLTRSREDARAVWIWPWLESVLQDLRYAMLGLRRQPSFATVAILALGCAIGLNTSFFTVFEAIALRPWPVKDARHIVRIFSLNTLHIDSPGFSVPEFHYLRDHAHSLSGMLAMQGMAVHFGFEPFGGVTHVIFVDADHFRVLGINMARNAATSPKATSVLLAGRLTPGVAERRAQAELETLSRQFHAQFALDRVRIVFAPTTMMGRPARRQLRTTRICTHVCRRYSDRAAGLRQRWQSSHRRHPTTWITTATASNGCNWLGKSPP